MLIEKLSYEDYEKLLFNMYTKIKNENFSEIIAVMRKGMIPSQYLSCLLGIPCGVYYPADNLLVRRTKAGKILFVDDVISVGRTVNTVISFMDSQHPNVDWKFFSIFIDTKYVITDSRVIDSFRPDNWLVVPWSAKDDIACYEQLTKTGTRMYSRDSLIHKECM